MLCTSLYRKTLSCYNWRCFVLKSLSTLCWSQCMRQRGNQWVSPSSTIEGLFLTKVDIAVLMWDMLAYFLDELEYVWKGKWSFITLLYAATRYGILLELLMQLYFPTKHLLTVTVSLFVNKFCHWFLTVSVLVWWRNLEVRSIFQ